MERALGYYQKVTNLLLRIILIFGGIVIGLDVVSIFLEAVGRYLVGSSRAFMEEVPRLLVPFVVFPMMGALLKLKRHIAVNVLPGRFRGKGQSLLLITVYSIVVAVAVQFFIAGVVAVKYYFDMGFETHTEFVIKSWVSYLPFPVGFGLLILFAIELLWEELVRLIKLVKEETS